MSKKIISPLILILAGLAILVCGPASKAQDSQVHIVRLNNDSINPVTADYITKAIDRAEVERAECLIIELDTPGGLLESTRSIVKRMLSSRVPVVVYIYPSGSRAGSAGVFITYASHVAVMAPSTNIGAAHPVSVGGDRQEERRTIWDALRDLIDARRDTRSDESEEASRPKSDDSAYESEETDSDGSVLADKILNDTVAYIRSIAKLRNRNEEWGVLAVTKSESITAQQAVETNVVDLIANGENELLEKLDGRVVTIDGQEVTLHTKKVFIKRIDMDSRQQFLNVLANPNIAYILMILGFYGLMYEVTHPGFGVPGVLGLIFLILAFFSMQTLPTNYAGLALIILAVVLFIAEANVPGFGFLTLGGVVSMVLGSLILFDSREPIMQVSLTLILPLTLTTAAITIFLVKLVLSVHRRRVISGQEGMIGLKGKARHTIKAGQEGKVSVHGEIWNAVATEDIKKGDQVEVVAIEAMVLTVKKI